MNDHCSSWEMCETHKYSLWAESRVLGAVCAGDSSVISFRHLQKEIKKLSVMNKEIRSVLDESTDFF